MKKFCVAYSWTQDEDTVIEAKDTKEAIKKVKEVIKDIRIEGCWEVKENA